MNPAREQLVERYHDARRVLEDLAATVAELDLEDDDVDTLLGLAGLFAGPACRMCGCTQELGCDDGCSWAEEDLCSACDHVGLEVAFSRQQLAGLDRLTRGGAIDAGALLHLIVDRLIAMPIELTRAEIERIVELLNNPPEPTEALIAALRRDT